MLERRIKKKRKKRMRSYRKAKLFLWAFAMAGLGLGVALIGWFGMRGNWHLARVGVVYVLVSGVLFGVRGVLAHHDDARKRRRELRSSPRLSS
jgi:fatty acid desaturase